VKRGQRAKPTLPPAPVRSEIRNAKQYRMTGFQIFRTAAVRTSRSEHCLFFYRITVPVMPSEYVPLFIVFAINDICVISDTTIQIYKNVAGDTMKRLLIARI